MRPRFFNRGKARRSVVGLCLFPRFNEAAIFQSRKAWLTYAIVNDWARFNEAAIFQSRKENDEPTTSSKLSGPSFNEAAIFQSRKGNNRLACLCRQAQCQASMRPRFFNRGNSLIACNDSSRFNEAACTASMRPRFFNRGKFASVNGESRRMGASMRPRFFNRGKIHSRLSE